MAMTWSKCPLCDYRCGTIRFNQRHANLEHWRMACGRVLTSAARHRGCQLGDVCSVVGSVPGPGPGHEIMSADDMRAEIDRLKCELMAFAGVDVANVDRLRRERDSLRHQAECYRKAILALLEADKHRDEAWRLLLEGHKTDIELIRLQTRRERDG